MAIDETHDVRQTPLHDEHVRLGARMAPFGGWDMPIQYATGILAEHRAVRTAAGVFDVSHMGRLSVWGERGLEFVRRMFTNDAGQLRTDQAQYSLLLRDDGGTLDDALVYRLDDHMMLVVNAGNTPTDVAWLRGDLPSGVELRDDTESSGMLAVQGPLALETVQRLTEVPLRRLRYYHCTTGTTAGISTTISRTGYTGEDGVELICPADSVVELWQAILRAGQPDGVMPAGLGARDTLRTEASMTLYGHELTVARTPFEAGLQRYVAMDKGWFHGREALERQGEVPPQTLVGLALEGRAPARADTSLYSGDREVGVVTSGTFSPTLERSIAMAYLDRDLSAPGTTLEAAIRDRRHTAQVVPLPFYHRRRKG